MLKYFFQDKNIRIKNQIKDIKGNKENFLNDLKKVNYLEIYEKSLSFLLTKADNFFGDRLLSFKAFSTHFVLSVIYSFLFFLFSYVITGANEISHLKIMSKEDNLFMRILFILFILLFYFILFMYFKKNNEIINWFSSILKTDNEIINWFLFIAIATVGVTGAIELIVIPGGIGIAGVIGGTAIGIAGGGIGISVELKIREIVGIAGVGVGVLLGLFLHNKEIDIILLTIIMLYYLLFPLINAFSDFISTAYSRYLAKKLSINIKERNHLLVMPIAYFMADIIFAIITFFILATLLYSSFDLANYFAISMGAKEDILIPKEIYQSLRENFFGEYLWITIMLFSTFVPTIAHLVITSFSFISFIALERKNKHIISLIESNRIREGAEEYVTLKIRKKILSIILFMIISSIFLYFIDLPRINLDDININFNIDI